MSVKLECDRCGAQEQTSGVMLFAGLTGPAIPTARPELPDGWTRPTLPHEDGSAWQHELCPACKADLIRFMAGQPVIDDAEQASQLMRIASPLAKPGRLNARGRCFGCGHAPHIEPCRELTMPGAPGDVDECGCTEGAPLVDDPEAAMTKICPDCGHLRHSTRCPDHVAEVGACGCDLRTDPKKMKELGIDD